MNGAARLGHLPERIPHRLHPRFARGDNQDVDARPTATRIDELAIL
jgi:hypothetical protein